jgi:hypothetical protein
MVPGPRGRPDAYAWQASTLSTVPDERDERVKARRGLDGQDDSLVDPRDRQERALNASSSTR